MNVLLNNGYFVLDVCLDKHGSGSSTVPQQEHYLSSAGAVLCLQWEAEKEPIPTIHLPVRYITHTHAHWCYYRSLHVA